MKKYQIIYADPPWNSNSQFTRDKKKGNEQHYPLMTLEDIKKLPVGGVADENCILFLWVVDTQLFEAKEVIEAWGFKYKTVGFTWVKKTAQNKDHFGVGMWTRKNPEICLIATKGHPKRLNAGIRQLQYGLKREHSRKPDEIRDEIVRLVGNLPRLEMFARTSTEGWDVWGNEVEGITLKSYREELDRLWEIWKNIGPLKQELIDLCEMAREEALESLKNALPEEGMSQGLSTLP